MRQVDGQAQHNHRAGSPEEQPVPRAVAGIPQRSTDPAGGRDGGPGQPGHGQQTRPGPGPRGWRADGPDLPILVDKGAKPLGQAGRGFGAARGTDNAVIVLLGTGVGTCIVSNGEVYRGATSSAGEWGHTRVCVGGRTCRCGADGCLEAYVGAGAIAARYEQLKRRRATISPGELEGRVAAIIAARGSDRAADQVLDETITYLGAGIADLVNLFNPERVVVGGWLGRALGDELLPQITEAAGRRALHLPFSRVEIGKGDLGRD